MESIAFVPRFVSLSLAISFAFGATRPLPVLSAAHLSLASQVAQDVLDTIDAEIKANPSDPEARVKRCLFLAEKSSKIADTTERNATLSSARSDCQQALKLSPNGRRAAFVRDLLKTIDRREVILEKNDICPENASQVERNAFQSFRAKNLETAVSLYEQAVNLCPDNASLRIRYGHTFFMAGNLVRAQDVIAAGLKLDPWNRTGHMFLSDLYRLNGQFDLAYDEAILAVVSNPTYEQGWEVLKELVESRGEKLRRFVNRRPVVTIDEKGGTKVILPSDTVLESPETQFWLGLGFGESTELTKAFKSPPVIKDNRSALEQDRERVKVNLEFMRDLISRDPSEKSLVADVMEEAEREKFLDEAIFIHLMDARLAPDYIKFREEKKVRLIEYVRRFVAPINPSPAKTPR